MDIIVGVKVIYEEQDISVNASGGLDVSSAAPKIGQFDLNALQAACDIKAQIPDAKIKALSIGGKVLENPKVQKDILSRGADELYILAGDEFANLSSTKTAQLFADAARQIGYSLIITGDGSADLFSSCVGLLAGARLDIPAINGISAIKDINSASISVLRDTGTLSQELLIPLPAAIALSSDINTPAPPSMKAILAASKKGVSTLSLSLQDSLDSMSKPTSTTNKQREHKIEPDDSDESVARFVLNLKQALGE